VKVRLGRKDGSAQRLARPRQPARKQNDEFPKRENSLSVEITEVLSNRFSASAFDKNDKSAEQTLLGKL
jgi:hypothetical protein